MTDPMTDTQKLAIAVAALRGIVSEYRGKDDCLPAVIAMGTLRIIGVYPASCIRDHEDAS